MGQIIFLPLRRKAYCGFFQLEKSDGFGRERTRDLGYQRPACKPLDHRSRYYSNSNCVVDVYGLQFVQCGKVSRDATKSKIKD
jgi:hypothetical protein